MGGLTVVSGCPSCFMLAVDAAAALAALTLCLDGGGGREDITVFIGVGRGL